MDSRVVSFLVLSALTAVLLLVAAAVRSPTPGPEGPDPEHLRQRPVVRFLALGDMNLGRAVGQKILEGDTLYPFAAVHDTLASYDLVFANLESNLSDQDGETQSPDNNLVFTGPPAGARALALAGIRLVSTANNHALDYGPAAALETISSLREGGIQFAGTAPDSSGLFRPAIVTVHGIRIALFACTDIMNMEDTIWHRFVASADTSRMFPHLRAVRDSVDFVILSVHGGEEYSDRPTQRMARFARAAVDEGVDLVLGHHPHVPYGIERHDGRYIVFSLGNFVFSQPARYWTQRSFAFAGDIVKGPDGTRIERFRCLPVRCGVQPHFLPPGSEADSIYERVRMQSMTNLAEARR